MLILDDIIASSGKYLENIIIFPTDWCIDMMLLSRYVGLCTHSILTQLPYKYVYAYDKYLGQPLQNARLSLTISNWQRNLSFILTDYGIYS